MNYKILLASNSPRRRELLGMICPDFAIADPLDVDETYPASLPHDSVPAYLSQVKARPYIVRGLSPDTILVTADTVVILDDKILGKPHSHAEAVDMLTSLQGRDHKVVTGVTLTCGDGRSDTFAEHTTVHFGPLTRSEIEWYIDTYKPYDKAGAYGIQEWIGGAGIKSIEGCFYNVMGLPLHTLFMHLKKIQACND